MVMGVYKIVNTENGKMYIGSSVDVERRFSRHRKDLDKGQHHCEYLQRAWNKHGRDSFSFEVIEECKTEEDARLAEQKYIDSMYDTLYNTSKVSSGGDLISYHPRRAEIVEKMSKSLQEKYKNMTPEERKLIYGSHKNGMTGRTHTKEVREKLSEIKKGNQYAKGVRRTPEQKARLAEIASQRVGEKNSFYGRKHTEETKRRLSEKMKGKLPPNTKQVIVNGVTYPSATAAAKELGVATATVLNRVRSDKFPQYSFLES